LKPITPEKAAELYDRATEALNQFEEVLKHLLTEFEAIEAERLYSEADRKAK
jgi:hypothetical protein